MNMVDKPKAATGVTRRLAETMAGLSFDALPADLVELIKQCVLDTLGVSIGASGLADEAAMVEGYVRDLAGKPESTIWGFGGKAPAAWAAFVNGSLGHMLDYDDLGAGSHVSITTVPVAFAVAEQMGGASGRALITAIAAGFDFQARLGGAVRLPDWTMTEGWFATQLFGYMAGAATAGRLLDFDDDHMENAIGIGFNQTAGSRQMAVGEATHMRSMQAGFSAQGGILAAQLAQRGVIGDKEPLEGRYGLFKTYVRDDPDWETALAGLGTSFPILESHGFKVWPACGYTRAPNAAILELRRQHQLTPDQVARIIIVGGSGGTKLLCEPLAAKRRPTLAIDGKYSIPFTAAVMMAKGDVRLADYTDAGLHDPAVLAMADRVFYRDDEAPLPSGGRSSRMQPGIEIETIDGRRLAHKVTSMPGDAKNPIGRPELEAKFRDCVSFSKVPVAKDRIEQVIEAVWNLDNLVDATDILRLLA